MNSVLVGSLSVAIVGSVENVCDSESQDTACFSSGKVSRLVSEVPEVNLTVFIESEESGSNVPAVDSSKSFLETEVSPWLLSSGITPNGDVRLLPSGMTNGDVISDVETESCATVDVTTVTFG